MKEIMCNLQSSQNTQTNYITKEYKDLLIIKSINLAFDIINEYNKSYDEDLLLTNAMDAITYFVNNGIYTKENFTQKVSEYVREQLNVLKVTE